MQATKTALDYIDSWPQFVESAYDTNPELRTKDSLLAFLDDTENSFANRTMTPGNHSWLDIAQFHTTHLRSLAGHMTTEFQARGKTGFWSKLHAVDNVVWSLVSLVPVRAIGAVFFFRGTKLDPEERMVYLGYRRRAEDSLARAEQLSPEIGRQMAAFYSDNSAFWQSLDALTEIVDSNVFSAGDRLVSRRKLCFQMNNKS